MALKGSKTEENLKDAFAGGVTSKSSLSLFRSKS